MPRLAAAVDDPAVTGPLWDADTVTLCLLDYQPETFAGLRGADPRLVELNARLLAKSAVTLGIPVVLSTVGVNAGFNHPTIPSLLSDLPGANPIDRNTMDAWADRTFRQAVMRAGRRRLVVVGLYTEICVVYPSVHALHDGFAVATAVDATAGQSAIAHDTAVMRLAHAGATTSTAMSMVCEWIRDWASPQASKVMPVLMWYQSQLPST